MLPASLWMQRRARSKPKHGEHRVRDFGTVGGRADQPTDRPTDGRLVKRADILNRSRIHIPRRFYPAVKNSAGQTRRLLIGGHDATVFRVRRNPVYGHTRAREGEGKATRGRQRGNDRGRARSRFDPRMIIRRQVISGSRYTGGVMGKTVTLLSYPL